MARMLRFAAAATLALAFAAGSGDALADKFKNPKAVFAGLDKVTGRIISFEVAIDETVQFGALQLTPKVCFTRASNQSPQTTSFVEVDEITLSSEQRRIFTGWMFASSPGLNGVEHPVYDIWLTNCHGSTERDRIRVAPEPVEVVAPAPTENQLARPLGPDGRPQADPNDRARQRQQVNRSTTAGPIIPGQPLNTQPFNPPPQRAVPTQRFFPTPGTGIVPGIFVDPARN
jgi:hypothetical protein